MRQGKLLVLAIFVMVCSLTMFSTASGQGKKGAGGNAKLGASVFEANCSPCHAGGENTVEPAKTLKSAALKENGFNGVDDIKKRVEEGKGIMPAFKEQLKAEEIDAVANYVWGKAQKDWK